MACEKDVSTLCLPTSRHVRSSSELSILLFSPCRRPIFLIVSHHVYYHVITKNLFAAMSLSPRPRWLQLGFFLLSPIQQRVSPLIMGSSLFGCPESWPSAMRGKRELAASNNIWVFWVSSRDVLYIVLDWREYEVIPVGGFQSSNEEAWIILSWCQLLLRPTCPLHLNTF